MIVCGIGASGTQSGPEFLPLQTSDVCFRKCSNGWWGEHGAHGGPESGFGQSLSER